MTERTTLQVAFDAAEAQFKMMPSSNVWDIARAVHRQFEAAGLLRDPVKEAAEPIMVQLLCLLDPTGEHSMAELMRRLAIAERALATKPIDFQANALDDEEWLRAEGHNSLLARILQIQPPENPT